MQQQCLPVVQVGLHSVGDSLEIWNFLRILFLSKPRSIDGFQTVEEDQTVGADCHSDESARIIEDDAELVDLQQVHFLNFLVFSKLLNQLHAEWFVDGSLSSLEQSFEQLDDPEENVTCFTE